MIQVLVILLLITSVAQGDWTLSVTATHGIVVREPNQATYADGTVVYLFPVPGQGYCFDTWSGDISRRQYGAKVVMDANKSITAIFEPWHPPIGIPIPPFGITETYRGYDEGGVFTRNSSLTYHVNTEGGCYTHYVDVNDPNSTDIGNTYGTIAVPRKTIPLSVPAGSVVEIHGGPYSTELSYCNVTADGTAASPVFYRGLDRNNMPVITGNTWRWAQSYCIVENIDFDGASYQYLCTSNIPNHMVFRCNEFHNYAQSCIYVRYGDDLVFYANDMHDRGNWDTEEEGDYHGINLSTANRVWIIDNAFHELQGDALQHYGGHPTYVYFARNNVRHMREQAVDLKRGSHVVMSENCVTGCYHHTGGGCYAMTCNRESESHTLEDIWFIYNEISDSVWGINVSGATNPTDLHPYIIGNVIHNLYDPDYTRSSYDGLNINRVGIFGDDHIGTTIYNTFYNVPLAIYVNDVTGPSDQIISNNVISKASVCHIHSPSGGENNLVYNDGYSCLVTGDGTFTGTITDDPCFVDIINENFRLSAGSPGIETGASDPNINAIFDLYASTFGVDIRVDADGKPRTGTWDIGAYEYVIEAAGNLAVSGTSQNSATLRWTVPGEEGITGTPAQYDIRYAGSEITEGNWGTATQVLGEPIPGNFGTQQSFTITGLDPNATYCFAMKILDDVGHSSVLSNVISGATARSGNHAPVFTPIGDRSVVEMATLPFTISATDADANSLTYSASGLPTGAAFDPATRTFTWTPTDTQEGVYHVMFQVTDGQVAVSETITITVLSGSNHPPELAAIGNKTVNEGETLSFSISATDVDTGQTVTYSVSGLPSGAAFVGQDFTWTPGFDQAGVYNVTFTASDGQAQDSEPITITVVNVNRKPVLASVGSQQVKENFSLTFSVSATDPDGDPVNYSASGLPSGASFSAGTFSWTPSFTQAGTYSVTFIASDGSLSDTEQVTITVGNVADETAPAVVDLYPEPDAIQIPVNPLIVFAISDAGLGVDANTVTIQVDGQLVYSGNQAESQSVYGICRRTGTKASYRYHYQPASGFDFDQRVSMSVTASDLANNVMDPCSYGFATEMRSFGGNEAISPSGSAGGHSAMATDSQGDLWAVCHAGQEGLRDVYVMNRDGSTLSWGDPVRLTDPTSDQCNPVVAVAADDAVYVAWQDNRRGNWDIYVSSTADGVTWRDAVRVTDSNDNQTHPAIAIDSSNPPRVYIAWEDDSAGNQNIWLASSNTSFAGSTIAQVTSNAADETEPALAAGLGNVVYAVWTDRRNGSADIYGAASNASWTNRPVVTGDGDQYSPAIAVESGTSSLHFVWVDDAAGNPDVLYGGSTGLPASAFAGVLLVDDTTDAGQLAPAIVAASDSLGRQHVYACWQDGRASGDIPDTDLYFVEIRSGTAGTNILVGDDGANSDQSEPALGFDGDGQPVILWTDDRDVTPYIYVAGGSCFGPTALASASIPSASGGIVGPAPAAIDEITDISIRIPANAYDCDAVYTIWQVHNLPLFASACLAACEIGPSGVEFLSPATITMPHATSSTGLAVPYWYDAQTGTLSREGISNVANTTSANGMPVISFQTTHLTSFYILEGTVSDGGGGGGGGCSLAPGKAKQVDKTMPSTSNKKQRSQRDPVPGTPKVAGMVYPPEAVEYFIPYAALAGIMIRLRIRDRRRYRR